MELRVHADHHDVAQATAQLVADQIRTSKGRFSLGLAGGTTPKETYRLLHDLPIDWSRVEAWLADERWVAPESDDSNGKWAQDLLVTPGGPALHRPKWGASLDPARSAAGYERLLRSIHAESGPDLVLLGMGTDGHTASLFPGSDALKETKRWYVFNRIPESGEQRLTATYPLLHRASLIVVVVTGESKAEALADSFGGTTPAGRLGEGSARTIWMADQPAARLLN